MLQINIILTAFGGDKFDPSLYDAKQISSIFPWYTPGELHQKTTFTGNLRTKFSMERVEHHSFFKKINLFIYLFIYVRMYVWLRWVFVAGRGLSLVAASAGYSSLWCTGFSLRCLLLLQSTGSRRAGFSSCGSWALGRRLSTCGARA